MRVTVKLLMERDWAMGCAKGLVVLCTPEGLQLPLGGASEVTTLITHLQHQLDNLETLKADGTLHAIQHIMHEEHPDESAE